MIAKFDMPFMNYKYSATESDKDVDKSHATHVAGTISNKQQ